MKRVAEFQVSGETPAGLVVYPFYSAPAPVVGVTYLLHFRDHIGDVDEVAGHIPARQDKVKPVPFVSDGPRDRFRREEAGIDGMGDLVKDKDIGAAGGEFLFGDEPTLLGGFAMRGGIVTFLEEPGADGADLNKGNPCFVEYLFSRFFPTLHELKKNGSVPVTHSTERYAQCSRGFPLSVTGEDNDEPFFVSHSC